MMKKILLILNLLVCGSVFSQISPSPTKLVAGSGIGLVKVGNTYTVSANAVTQTITLTGDVTGSGTGTFATTAASTIVKNVVLNTSGVLYATPVTYTTTSNTATGTLALNTQTPNTFLAGATSGTVTPTFRAIVQGDIPSGYVDLASTQSVGGAKTFTTSITSALIQGSASASGTMTITPTSSATKTSSAVYITSASHNGTNSGVRITQPQNNGYGAGLDLTATASVNGKTWSLISANNQNMADSVKTGSFAILGPLGGVLGVAAVQIDTLNRFTVSSIYGNQFRARYNRLNYFNVNVSSTGSATFLLAGTSPVFTFSNPVSATTSTITTVNSNTVAVSGKATVPTLSYPSNTTDAASTAYVTAAFAANPSQNMSNTNLTLASSYTATIGTGLSWTLKGGTFNRVGENSASGTDWINATNSSTTKMLTAHNNGRFNFGDYSSELAGNNLRYHFIGSAGRTAKATEDYSTFIIEDASRATFTLLGPTEEIRFGSSTAGNFGTYFTYDQSSKELYLNSNSGGLSFFGTSTTNSNLVLGYAGAVHVNDGSIYTVLHGDAQVWAEPTTSSGQTSSGKFYFRTTCNNGSPLINNDYIQNIAINNTSLRKLSFTVGGSERAHIKSNGVFNITPMTAVTASAITPAEGDIVFVSTTDATFLTVGFWGYQGGIWVKM